MSLISRGVPAFASGSANSNVGQHDPTTIKPARRGSPRGTRRRGAVNAIRICCRCATGTPDKSYAIQAGSLSGTTSRPFDRRWIVLGRRCCWRFPRQRPGRRGDQRHDRRTDRCFSPETRVGVGSAPPPVPPPAAPAAAPAAPPFEVSAPAAPAAALVGRGAAARDRERQGSTERDVRVGHAC